MTIYATAQEARDHYLALEREKLRRSGLMDPEVAERWEEMFGVRGANALRLEGIITDDELNAMTDAELLRIPNLGKVTLAAIRACVPLPPRLCPHCGKSLAEKEEAGYANR